MDSYRVTVNGESKLVDAEERKEYERIQKMQKVVSDYDNMQRWKKYPNRPNWEQQKKAATYGKEVKVSGMPNLSYYPNKIECFHQQSGMDPSKSFEENGGKYILGKTREFYQTVYGLNDDEMENIPIANYAYSLYGSKTKTNDKFNNSYHIGVDMDYKKGAQIYSAHDGVVTINDGAFFGIYNEDTNKTYYYLHMKQDESLDEGDPISKGQPIGKQSNEGLIDEKEDKDHLHFEVYEGKFKEYGSAINYYPSVDLAALIPYDYMGGLI